MFNIPQVQREDKIAKQMKWSFPWFRCEDLRFKEKFDAVLNNQQMLTTNLTQNNRKNSNLTTKHGVLILLDL